MRRNHLINILQRRRECMDKEKQNRQIKSSKEGYIIVPNTFLKKWVKVLGVGPVVLYQELLTYCHKGKYIAWPTIDSLCHEMGIAKTTLLRYQNTLLRFGLIKNISRGKSTTGHYKNNIYQITSLEELTECPDHDKIIDFLGSKMKPDRYQNDTSIGSNVKLSLVSNRYPNNTNLNITNTTTAKEGDVAADFKKLKEKGDLSACNAQAEEKMRAIRERMVDLDFKEAFIEKILKEYSVKKIKENLDLLLERKNIQKPAGWLMAALKNNYQDAEGEKYEEELKERSSNLINTAEWTSREKAMEAIRMIQDNLSTCISPLPSRKRDGVRVNQKLIQERRFKCPN
jgi:hypothetical protein